MNKVQEAYIKGVAHSIEVYAEVIKAAVQALQQHSLHDMPTELIEMNFQDVAESCEHIQRILSEVATHVPQEEK